jgi:polyhydroxybutyrate depolymerase
MKKSLLLIFVTLFLLSNSIFAGRADLNIIYYNTTRKCTVVTPSSYDGSKSLPLIIAYHGMTLSPAIMESESSLSIKAEAESFIVVYPPMHDTYAGWVTNVAIKPNDIEFTTILLDSLQAKYNVDKNRIYAVGFSNGGMITYEIAYRLSDKFAAIASVSGPLTETNVVPPNNIPILHFHAMDDDIIPYSNVQPALNFWIKFNKCAAISDTVLKVPGAVGLKWKSSINSDVVLYTTTVGRHSWPGGISVGFGEPSKVINATDIIWDFFNQSTLNIISEVKETQSKINPSFELYQNYPNPFNPATQISYNVPKTSEVDLSVFNLLGQHVATLFSGRVQAGIHSVKFDGTNLSSGLYFYVLSGSSQIMTKKMILLK